MLQNWLPFGRYVFGVGGHEEAASVSRSGCWSHGSTELVKTELTLRTGILLYMLYIFVYQLKLKTENFSKANKHMKRLYNIISHK